MVKRREAKRSEEERVMQIRGGWEGKANYLYVCVHPSRHRKRGREKSDAVNISVWQVV